jgi:hypothetical protein
MKTHRILGILWLALFCYSCFIEFRALLTLYPSAAGLWGTWFVIALFCLIYLAGIVASIFLFRGARWARWFIALFAVYAVFGCISCFATQKSLPVGVAVSGVFALVSLPLLFLPRHEPVA